MDCCRCIDGIITGSVLVKHDANSPVFEIRSSLFLKNLIEFAYAVAGISILVLPLPLVICLLLLAMLLAALSYQLRLVMQPQFTGVQFLDQKWSLINPAGQSISVALQDTTLVMPSMIILNGVSAEGRRHSLLLMSDSLEKQAFRRLRILLRWGS